MVDLSRVDEAILAKSGAGAHLAIKDVCSFARTEASDQKNAFILYHFSGTLEQMLFRSNDNRNTNGNGTAYRIERYLEDQKHAHEMSPVIIQEWFDAFVEATGLEEAKRLLEHVGKPFEAAFIDHPALI